VVQLKKKPETLLEKKEDENESASKIIHHS